MCNCLYVNGDSWTYGAELRDPRHSNIIDDFDSVHNAYRQQNNWPTLLGRLLGLEVFNGSVSGSSNDGIRRRTVQDVSKLLLEGRKPLVILTWSHIQRFELPEGPEGKRYRNFVGPSGSVINPQCVDEIFAKWSSDRTDLIRWFESMILLNSFFRQHALIDFSTCVYRKNWQFFWDYQNDPNLSVYYNIFKKWVNLRDHSIEYSLEEHLKAKGNIAFAKGGHPLEHGHAEIAEWFLHRLTDKFSL